MGLLWLGLAAFTVALVVLIWTRWGQYRPLRKCLVLSILAHLLLAGYATTVRIVAMVPPADVPTIAYIEGPGGPGAEGDDPAGVVAAPRRGGLPRKRRRRCWRFPAGRARRCSPRRRRRLPPLDPPPAAGRRGSRQADWRRPSPPPAPAIRSSRPVRPRSRSPPPPRPPIAPRPPRGRGRPRAAGAPPLGPRGVGVGRAAPAQPHAGGLSAPHGPEPCPAGPRPRRQPGNRGRRPSRPAMAGGQPKRRRALERPAT